MTDLENGLVLWLPLNDGKNSTKVRDKSKYQNHGTITGAVAVRPYNDMSVTSEEEGEAPLVVYDDDETFWSAWGVGVGSYDVVISEETTIKKKGTSSVKMVVGAGASVHVGVTHAYGADQDWSKYDFFTLWIYGTNTGLTMRTEIYAPDAANAIFTDFVDNFSGWQRKIIPLRAFTVGVGSPNFSTIRTITIFYLFANQNFTSYLDRTTVDVGNWRFGDAMFFDGINDYVTMPNLSDYKELNGKSLTVSCWINTSYTGTAQIIGTYSTLTAGDPTPNQSWIIRMNSGGYIEVFVRRDNSAEDLDVISPLGGYNDSRPHHIIMRKSGVNFSLWIDGKLVNNGSLSVDGATDNDQFLRLGVNFGNYFSGFISNVRIYNRVLTFEERQTLSHEKDNDLKRGLVLDLPLNEGSGTKVYDKSKHQNHGVISTATWIDGILNSKALSFDGAADYVTISGLSTNFPYIFSICLWVKSLNLGLFRSFVDKGWTAGWAFSQNSGKLHFLNASDQYSGTGSIPSDWAFICVTMDGSILKFYINGKLDSSQAITGLNNTTNTFTLAKNAGGGYFTGYEQGVKIYNRILLPEEIQALYQQNHP